jgi:hypothetical protein
MFVNLDKSMPLNAVKQALLQGEHDAGYRVWYAAAYAGDDYVSIGAVTINPDPETGLHTLWHNVSMESGVVHVPPAEMRESDITHESGYALIRDHGAYSGLRAKLWMLSEMAPGLHQVIEVI